MGIISLHTFALDFPENFLFGVANAPAHVEDQLDDPWMDFAKRGNTKSFLNHTRPDDRLEFWTRPEVEINLASELGVDVFRLGIDWQRLVPSKSKKITNLKAIKRYKEIFKLLRDKNIKIMLTLFHHSLPDWAIKMGGWTNPDLIDYFNGFAMDALKYFHEDIHFLITFNEPNVYSMFSYVTGMWPPGASNKWALINPLSGDFYTAQKNMAKAHNLLYQKIGPKQYDIKVSVAHNIANYKASKWYHKLNVWWANKYMNYYFLDLVRNNLDFLGFNYYGQEIIDFKGPVFKEGIQYSDAGRAVDAKGLLSKIESLYFRYSLPLFITENGVADSRDHLRKYYLLKHLGRIEEAISKDIPILGYIHWTLTDNFEWSDGYCPKFGLVAVDRKNDLKRIKRDSFYFYQRIISKKSINPSEIRKDYLANDGKLRDMCRSSNGIDALDKAKTQVFKAIL